MTGHYKWAHGIKATHLLAACKARLHVLHRIPKEEMYEEK
jgi:hypothetical protein